jgi:predicted AAA+ superfamily ATPase
VPDLLDEVHALIERRKLRFALTGSSARKLRRGANLLAGRARTLHMHPLTALELGRDFDLGRALRGTLPFACTTKDPDAYLRTSPPTCAKRCFKKGSSATWRASRASSRLPASLRAAH